MRQGRDAHLAGGLTLGSGDFSRYHIRAGWASQWPVLSINTRLCSESSSVLGRGGWREVCGSSEVHSSSHFSTDWHFFCGKPSDMEMADKRGPAWSDCKVPRLYKAGRLRRRLGGCPP